MTGPRQDRLDELLGALPREVPPGHDLWPAIEAQLHETASPVDTVATQQGYSWQWMRLAAGVLLVVGVSLVTFVVTRQYLPSQSPVQVVQQLPTPVLQAVPVSFGSQTLGTEYIALRSELLEHFQRRMEYLPPQARASLQRSLEDLQRAASEINAVLAEHPDDPLLQDLLMSTYQSEMQLLADVGGGASTRADL